MIVRELVTLLGFRNDDTGAREHERTLERVRDKAEAVASDVGNVMRNAMRALYAGIAAGIGGAALKTVTDAADSITNATNRINAAMEGDEAGAAEVFERIYAGARQTGVAMEETAGTFMRFLPTMKELGFDAATTADMIEGLQKGLISAGASSARTADVLLQLGQAINSQNFAGDELKSFLENAPPVLVRTFAESLGTTVDKLKEMGSEGKLTAKVAIPALIEAAKAGGIAFDGMQQTVAGAMAGTRVSITRFLSDFDKAIGLSRVAIRWIEAFGRRLDSLRSSLPTLRDIVSELGGLERMLQTVAVAIGIGTAAWLAYNRAALVAAMRTAAAFAPWVLGGLAVVAVAALIMDFVEWVGGEDVDTLFRRWFGPFADIQAQYAPQIEALQAAWEAFKRSLSDTYIALSADGAEFWPVLLEYLRTLWRTMDEVGQGIGNALRAIYEATRREIEGILAGWQSFKEGITSARDVFAQATDFISNLLQALVGRFVNGFGTIIGWIDRGKAALRSWLGMDGTGGAAAPQGAPAGASGPRRGTLAPWSPAPGDEAFRREMGDLLNLSPQAQPLAGAIGRGNSVNSSQANTIQNNVTVTATGASAPEVAAGVNQGLSRATDGMVNSLREVQVGMPLTEAPAQ